MRVLLERRPRGMTLIELLIAITVFFTVLGLSMQTLRSEGRAFAQGTERMGLLQNLRLAAALMSQDLQTAGGNVGPRQPPVVYAGPDAFAFNADYAANTPGDPFAAYVLPEAPAGQVSAWRLARAGTVPGSAPGFPYPAADHLDEAGMPSPAETITFFFAPDPETARGDDFVLQRQVNDQAPEVVARNILRTPGAPFFAYRYLRRQSGSPDQVLPVPAGWLPLGHTTPLHAVPGDTAQFARVDSLRGVDVAYTQSNGQDGTRQRTQRVAFTVALPNVGLARLRSCGAAPVLGQPLVAALSLPPGGSPVVDLQWNAAADEAGGEQDVARYVLWRRPAGAADWGDPLVSIPSGNAAYLYTDALVAAGASYQYALAAQDCTPTSSPSVVSNPVAVP